MISAGEARVYALNVMAGQRVRVEITKGDLSLKLSVCTRPDQSCLEYIGRRYGKLELSFSADISAIHRLEVRSLEGEAEARAYELRILDVVAATRRHRVADNAVRIAAEAEQLREQHYASAQLAAVSKYAEAQRLWESVGEFRRAAAALCAIGDVYFEQSQYRQALAYYVRSLSLGQRSRDRLSELAALNGIGYAYVYLGENQKALDYAGKMLSIIERAGDEERASADYRRAEAQALNTMGEVYYAFGELRKSIEMFERALPIWEEVKERSGEALALLNLGYSHSDLGDLRNASDHFQRSLTLWEAVSDGRGAALARTALGGVHAILGDEQLALDLHKRAVDYFRAAGNRQGEAAALNGIAQAYEDFNQHEAAFTNYQEALRLYVEIGNRDFAALNKFLVGRVLYRRGEIDRAFEYYRESLALSRDVGARVIEAHALKGLATVYFSRHDVGRALTQFEAAYRIYRQVGNLRSQAYILNDIGYVYMSFGDVTRALASYQQALPLMRDTVDHRGEALTLFNTARVERARGNLTAALSLIEQSIAISESLRTKIRNSELRTSFFASMHQQYEFYLDVLMRLNDQYPDRGFAVAALIASERARARSLLESLLEEKIEPRRGVSPELLKEQELLQALDEKARYQTRLLSRKHTEEEAAQVSEEIRALNIEYQGARSRLREQNPRSATLTQPGQLSAEDLQGIVKDDDTLLLEFALGEERSYLWVVSSKDITSYELPARATVEGLARRVYELLTARQSLIEQPSSKDAEVIRAADREYWQQSAALSRMILGPVAGRLGSKRLLIVGDGLLQYLPFEALPTPGPQSATEREPAATQWPEPDLLFFTHEIVSLPSALTLAALRSEKRPANPATKMIAVIADPVFDKNDPRLLASQAEGGSPAKGEDESVYLSSALRDFDDYSGAAGITRLPATSREAKAIMTVTPPGEGIIATGFAATKEKVVSNGLRNYRILHFATHGLLDVEHPELSGVILSLVDERGNNRDGFLRLHDIYNLELSADLVVLSACRTGLGKNVQGEGVIGLTRAFMFAGAKSVVASLWKVDDEATAELMSHFYTAMLRDGLPPALALKNAKLEMWKQKRWHAPFYWAAFVLQGEYKEEIGPTDRTRRSRFLIVAGILALFAVCLYAVARFYGRVRRTL